MDKFRDWIGGLISLIIFLSLALITAIFSKYLLNTSYSNQKIEGPTASLSEVLISQTGQSGELQSQLSAESIIFNSKNEATIINPVLLLFENNLNPIVASSEIADLSPDGEIIKLKTNVKIIREGINKSDGFQITANDTTFNLNLRTAFSDGPVRIKKSRYLITGVGMEIRQTERSINILKDVSLIEN